MNITREIATRVRDLVDAGLVSGIGAPFPGQMCVEAAVCYALGLPHGDDPKCVAQSLRQLKIRLNDSAWSSDQARAKGLRRLAVAQLGSISVLDEQAFVSRVAEMTIRKGAPIGLRAAAKLNPKHAVALEAAAMRCEQEGTREAASEGERVAGAAYTTYAADAAAAASAAASAAADATYAAYAYAANAAAAAAAYADAADAANAAAAADAAAAASAAADAAYAYAADAYAANAVSAAASAVSAAASAVSAAAAAAAAAAYADAADAATYAAAASGTRDRVLAQYAEWIVEILIDLKAPGCEYLNLVPLEVA